LRRRRRRIDCGYSGFRVPEAADHGALHRAPPRLWHGLAVLNLLALRLAPDFGVQGRRPTEAVALPATARAR